jgi:hypothetical protein
LRLVGQALHRSRAVEVDTPEIMINRIVSALPLAIGASAIIIAYALHHAVLPGNGSEGEHVVVHF